MRLARTLLTLALLPLAAGCLTSTTLIKVRPDGGGTLVETVTMSPERFNQIKGMMAMVPSGGPGTAPTEPFSEAEARAKAGQLGQGVTFVGSQKIDTPRARGLRATYAFSDVTKLRVSEKPSAPALASGPVGGGDLREEVGFRLARQPGGTSLLTVVFPKPRKPVARPTPASGSAPLAGPAPAGAGPEQAKMIREMFKGLKIGMAVEVDGRIVKTNSPFVDGSKVTLFDLDFDSLLANDAVIKQLQGPISNSVEEAKRLVRDTPGVKVNPDAEVTIEFAAK